MENMEKNEIIKNKSKKQIQHGVVALGIVVGIGLVIVGIIFVNYVLNRASDSSLTTSGISQSGDQGKFSSADANTIESVARKLSPSVVSIIGTAQSQSSFFYDYTETATAGTGVIATSDGYIITNKHVVENSTNLKVVLADGTTYEKVKIAAEDPLNDIAYLKIDGANNLVVAELGDSKALNIGQEVVAIGNALGQYAGTVTQGIVSGLNRTVRAASSSKNSVETLSDMIQTDAAINSGNSGGPLVNAKGQVIGINTAVASEAQGIGFAIPISATKGMLKSLIATGRAGRASLGVSYTSITGSVAKENNLPVNAGAWLYTRSGSSVVRGGSAADKARLKEKDIIVAVNGVKIGSAGSVSSLVGEYQPGETVKLSVVRDGRNIELSATLDTFLIDWWWK